ncbi:sec-independent protein translocase protein TatB [Bathymodiolus platifrons methanotrophic gill symbiont]|uniref:Sec-independent protein translocase protein TatB n=1 Tax=Bathymodiolus platifrons methanotrophic gill symbiont TaxID=113268 RepID=UPI000B40D478|nr:Sec-independent protein translocase protein TatB [Bathymodiolus platifrons methanotrophic gill symbiont]MCK5869830.1 twin-arginine translocase subunit TatB [Methyloprofundus sp.]TXL01406.1 twin-arginine translocase subunit TatB [Methylococcaceae bacterium HT1]TXL14053.1 twin-arginine translocase subunit TatB [Methylococcaceae bacterium HT4]TXL17828.1 twin-arginine translocase subunit TatB [Methylococcaceae bacterium HT3]TXL20770.1 twin-arginine translocase subunit TatB [Methylococcaceae bac
MFDIGFWELCLIGLVSLLVIGPEKLPKVARIAGFWLGKTRNMVAVVKEEIKEEFKEEELRQLLQEQQDKIDSMTSGMNLNGRAEHFLDAKKESTDKEKHGEE